MCSNVQYYQGDFLCRPRPPEQQRSNAGQSWLELVSVSCKNFHCGVLQQPPSNGMSQLLSPSRPVRTSHIASAGTHQGMLTPQRTISFLPLPFLARARARSRSAPSRSMSSTHNTCRASSTVFPAQTSHAAQPSSHSLITLELLCSIQKYKLNPPCHLWNTNTMGGARERACSSVLALVRACKQSRAHLTSTAAGQLLYKIKQ